MCRIAGIISPIFNKNELIEFTQKMVAVQKHGGPDDDDVYGEGLNFNGVLGHCRLSIIDVTTGGHQPMSYLSQRYVISYNGEIYNYKELREELKTYGYTFTTQSDTEVILAAYDMWGTNSFGRLNGMFAFSICDTQKNEMVLARDVAGIKPLYYSFTKHGFAFSSEVRALKVLPYLKNENKNWPVYLMAYGHLPEPVTTLSDVTPLSKGYFLKYDVTANSITTDCFERLKYIEKISRHDDAVSMLQLKLDEAVQRHLISDAPIGVFLSGGLDSSIIALLASKHQKQLNTVSLYFDNKEYSEKKYQDELLKNISCSHNQFLLTENDFHSFLPDIIKAMDLPCCDGINTWFISRYAKQSGLKAVLSGIGGDELFGGYPSFNRIDTALLLSHLPGNILKAGRFANQKKLRRLCYLGIKGPIGKYLFLRGQFIPSDIARFLNADESEIWRVLEEQPVLPGIGHLSASNQASWLETNMYMQNQLLRDADTMSMAHGLEIRVPYLDKEFASLALMIQSDVKYKRGLGKQLLIDAFKDFLPRVIWDRPKMGFSFPFHEWLSKSCYTTAADGTDLSVYHSRLTGNQMHWSQFFTLLLLHTYGNE
jgi:asparagine synthase (glutamine-hydrolysing)